MSDFFHEYTDSEPMLLSPEGRARRERILAAGMEAAGRRGRRRSLAHAAGAVALLTLCAGMIWMAKASQGGPVIKPDGGDEVAFHPPNPPAAEDVAASEATRGTGIVVVGNTPAAARDIERIDDAQLLALLAETGGSYGLVAVGDRTEVVRNDR